MTKSPLSFSELERRIRAIPDGPVSVLNTPSWIARCNVFGAVGIIVGLLPSLLIKVMEPQMWMAQMARYGVWIAVIGYLPGVVRSVSVAGRSMWQWKSDQPRQLDHDFDHLRNVAQELAVHSAEGVSERLRFVQAVQARLQAKLAFLAGGLEKLGVLPLLLAVGIQLKAYSDASDVPLWQAGLGLFLAVTYLIAMIGQLMRLRLQLYETVLSETLIACERRRVEQLEVSHSADLIPRALIEAD